MGTWNHRIMLHKAGSVEKNPALKWGEYLAIHEVHYDDNGNPEMASKDALGILGDEGKDSLSSIKWILEKMMEALDKPILDYDTLKKIDKEKQDDFSKSIEAKEQTSSEDQ